MLMHPLNLSSKKLPDIDHEWTLFLDRDGIINKEIIGGYILSKADFIFENGATDALQILSRLFQRIFVVSNQRGVAKGLMTKQALDELTEFMLLEIKEKGGRVDEVFYCTALHEDDLMRKPNKGMALLAKDKYPEIAFTKSIMVGNMPSDMLFGRKIGAFTVYVPTRMDETPEPDSVDASFKTLLDFAKAFQLPAP